MRYENILLPVDLADDAIRHAPLEQAVDFCRDGSALLHLVTVVPEYGLPMVSQFFPPDYEKKALEAASKQLHEWSAAHVPADVKVQHTIGQGSVYREILRVAKEVKADLIVIAAHRREIEDYFLGSNAARVVRHATCSVLVTREP